MSQSAIPIPYRKWIVRLADLALEIRKELGYPKDSAQGQTLGCIYTTLLDFEFSAFRDELPQFSGQMAPAVKFWGSLNMVLEGFFVSASYTKFNIATALLFFEKVVEKLIINGDGQIDQLSKDSLKGAVSIAHRFKVMDAETQEISSLHHMLQYLEKRVSPIIDPFLVRRIAIAKSRLRPSLEPDKELLEIMQEQQKYLATHNISYDAFNAETQNLVIKYPERLAWLCSQGMTVADFKEQSLAFQESLLKNVPLFKMTMEKLGCTFQQCFYMTKKANELLQFKNSLSLF